MKARKIMMIPGPVEFTPDVLSALGLPMTSIQHHGTGSGDSCQPDRAG